MIKNKGLHGAMKRYSLFAFFALFAFMLSPVIRAQGWNFTFTVTTSGPCGGYMPYIPTFTIPYMPTQSYCESIRQNILSIRVSQPMTDEYGNYIGDCSVFYTCTPCSGSDMASASGQSEPGSVSIDGLLQGTSFFSPHQTGELESWMNDYTLKLKSMGITMDENSSFTAQDIPLTGEPLVDEFYVRQSMEFEKTLQADPDEIIGSAPETPGTPVTSEEIGTTVSLLRTPEDIRKEQEWMEEHGFNNMQQVGTDNAIDPAGSETAGMSWGEAAVREYVGGNAAGSLMLKYVDGTFNGLNKVTTYLSKGDLSGAAEYADGIPVNVVRTGTTEWAKDQATDYVTGGITGPVLGLVKNADKVHSVVSTGISVWNTKQGN
ncbi:MAG: hypothetical protein JW830_01370 [Bacteroidales bacterium]|nr:hypothetical protein [Bacteroidales bacterium]